MKKKYKFYKNKRTKFHPSIEIYSNAIIWRNLEVTSSPTKSGRYIELKKNPSQFEKLARENSEDVASGQRGGDLGFFAYEEMVEPFAEKAFSMAPNTISEVVETPYGYHIIMVTDRSEAGTLSFEKAKKDIINYLESLDKVDILINCICSTFIPACSCFSLVRW